MSDIGPNGSILKLFWGFFWVSIGAISSAVVPVVNIWYKSYLHPNDPMFIFFICLHFVQCWQIICWYKNDYTSYTELWTMYANKIHINVDKTRLKKKKKGKKTES